MSGPLAFLWLVVGYHQQGEELRLNTQALSLQVTELQNSIAQQKIIATTGRQELAIIQTQHERDLEREAEAINSKFEILSASEQELRTYLRFYIKIQLNNNHAKDVSIELKSQSNSANIEKASMTSIPDSWIKQESHAIYIMSPNRLSSIEEISFELTISFTDNLGESNLQGFKFISKETLPLRLIPSIHPRLIDR